MKTKYSARRYKRKTIKSKTNQSFASRVQAVLKKQVETKFSIIGFTEASINTLSSPSTTYALNNLGQGSSISTRIGSKVKAQYIDVRGHVHTADGNASQYVRVLLLSAALGDDGLTDLVETNTGATGPAGLDVSAIYARINTSKYRVLGERILKLGPSLNSYGTKFFHFKKKLNMSLMYDQGSNVPERNKIFMVVFPRRADNDESLGTTSELTFNSKFYYTDM